MEYLKVVITKSEVLALLIIGTEVVLSINSLTLQLLSVCLITCDV